MVRVSLLFLITLTLLACDSQRFRLKARPKKVDWKEIKKSGVLTVLAENGPASYFIYKGRNMGYEYELLHEFGKDVGIRIQIKTVHNFDSIFSKLYNFEGDLIAYNLTVTPERAAIVNFSDPHLISRQVLIQRIPPKFDPKKDSIPPTPLITELEQLAGKTVSVWSQSTHLPQIKKINEALNLNMNIVPLDGDITTEEIIRLVSIGLLDYTISDENIAQINQIYWDNLDIDLKLSSDEEIAFAARLNSTELIEVLNEWLNDKKNRSTIAEVRRKYFHRKRLPNRASSEYSSSSGSQLSPYDDILKKGAKKIGWDWRLISAIIYQESKFETYKISWAGAFGIFQFMPATAAAYGIGPASSVETQLNAGIRKLNKNFKQWLSVVPDSLEATYFTLATYNAGRAHIDDARALAPYFNKDSSRWFGHVDSMVLGLSRPKYYNHQAVKYGYMRGNQTFNYVSEIMERFVEYKHAYPESND